MIIPKQPQTRAAVAAHYDELDSFYREIWGEHVHHGYWRTGKETAAQATEALVRMLADTLAVTPGQRLVDIGCGYGAAARFLADRHGADVTGFTVSSAQAAQARPPSRGRVTVLHHDWLSNNLAPASFDNAYAIESSEHMVDKGRFFAEAFRTLKPGGSLAIFAWLAAEAVTSWQHRHLLEPICREGRLPSMGTESDYLRLAGAAGFHSVSAEDLSDRVSRTWRICLGRCLAALATKPRYIHYLLDRSASDRIFALTMVRILLAYRVRAMRYCLLVLRRPAATG